MSRKGMPMIEKRQRMLQLFHEKRDFFTLKELEKIAPKEKGIVQGTVKDVLQLLVDDDVISTDKIGRQVYFWCFPGQNLTALESQISQNNKKIVEYEFENEKLKEEIEKEKIGKEDSEEREILLGQIANLRTMENSLLKRISVCSDIDPDAIAKLGEKAQEYKEATNIWTDNIYSIQSYCRNKFGIETKVLNKQFRIPEDLDYVE